MENAKELLLGILNDGTIHRFRSHITIIATGGYGKIYYSATAAHTCTGDGNGMVLACGITFARYGICSVSSHWTLWNWMFN